ncbi:MAG: acyl-CoA dehydrogenase family protein [Lysobacterales bacterium]
MNLPDLLPFSDRARALHQVLGKFIDQEVQPAEAEYEAHLAQPGQRWTIPPVIETLKSRARALGLWNLFLPDPRFGAGLSSLDYAPLAERMGHAWLAPEVCNCNAPDTGNMEVLAHYGSAAQQQTWLQPLLRGEIRSAFAMTEPAVASSDATNIATRIEKVGDRLRVSGRKWWITGASDPRCAFFLVMGVSDPDNDRHRRHSIVLVPRDTPGVSVLRPLQLFGFDDAPQGHSEVLFEQAEVPVENLIAGFGRGFEVAQGRLGPGRIHHCMRLIGMAERALAAMCQRANSRVAFHRPLAEQGMVREAIAHSRLDIEQARLLTLHAAHALDRFGAKGARDAIGMIKIAAPNMALKVIDRAIQIHGALGVSEDSFLSRAYAGARALRLADGPDEVHLTALAKSELARH